MAEESDKRKLRQKERKVYTDTGIDDDDIDGKRTFVVEEKLASDRYNAEFVREKKGTDVTLKMFQEEGLQFPMVIKDKTGLGMRVPSGRFTVADVKKCVGSRRVLDVMDVVTQRGTNMTMKEWVKYYEDKTNRDKLYNVISLEFSHTRLENYVEQPECVRQIDWVDTVWPPHLKECQTDGTNAMDKMKYPKVQKYCLMSVGGCYTDFHIDMGGTSVWYHILHGGKVFWLIPPTDENLAIYEEWTLSGKQGDDFLADRVAQCQRIQLQAGWTFFIPSGWIHAVYTPEDSLVFGGNFLHSFNVPTQLRAYESESRTHVPQKFRYPFFTELHWYVLDRYVSCVTGKHHRQKSEEEIKHEMESNDLFKTEPLSPGVFDANSNDSRDMSDGTGDFSNPGSPSCGDDQTDTSFNSLSPKSARNLDFKSKKLHKDNKSFNKKGLNQSDVCKPVSVKLENCLLINPEFKQKLALDAKKKVYLTPSEVEGIKAIVEWIESLPITKKMTPKDILDPEALIKDAKRLVQEHLDDDRELCMTGDFVLKWIKRKEPKIRGYTNNFHQRKPKTPRVKSEDGKNIRRRRVRCRKCEPCTRPDCEECGHCKDMKKYGGPGTKKQSCISRQCLAPELPVSAACMLCSTGELTTPDLSFEERQLYECGICWEIVHQPCFKDKNPALGTVEGVINEDLPNSWECPRCCEEGKQGSLKSRVWRSGVGKVTGSRHNSTSSEMSTDDHSVHDLYGSPSGTPLKYKPRPPGGEKSDRSPVRSNKSSPGDENTSPRKPGFRKREAEEGENSPKKKMRLDKGVTRPYNVPPNKPQVSDPNNVHNTTVCPSQHNGKISPNQQYTKVPTNIPNGKVPPIQRNTKVTTNISNGKVSPNSPNMQVVPNSPNAKMDNNVHDPKSSPRVMSPDKFYKPHVNKSLHSSNAKVSPNAHTMKAAPNQPNTKVSPSVPNHKNPSSANNSHRSDSAHTTKTKSQNHFSHSHSLSHNKSRINSTNGKSLNFKTPNDIRLKSPNTKSSNNVNTKSPNSKSSKSASPKSPNSKSPNNAIPPFPVYIIPNRAFASPTLPVVISPRKSPKCPAKTGLVGVTKRGRDIVRPARFL